MMIYMDYRSQRDVSDKVMKMDLADLSVAIFERGLRKLFDVVRTYQFYFSPQISYFSFYSVSQKH